MKSAVLEKHVSETLEESKFPQPLSPASEKLTGADIFFRTLIDCQVDTIFGYPGGKVLGLYDRMLSYDSITHILVNHEQGGTHAAEGYAKVTGKPGVVLTTSGPGATNTVTGIADAFMDSIPLVVFTGQVETPLIGRMAFQESNIVEITKPITKWNHQVRSVDQLEKVIIKAFKTAVEGKPGPVLVDLPKDVFMAEISETSVEVSSTDPVQSNPTTLAYDLEKIAKAIDASEKPVIYAGGGVISGEASEILTAFAIENQIPVTTTLMGLGGFPETHELSMGMLGMHGTWYANMAVQECDLLIAVGARFDDRVTSETSGFSTHSVKIHIDIDPTSINRNITVDYPIVDQVKPVLERLSLLVTPKERKPWLNRIKEWSIQHPLSYQKHSRIIKPQMVIEKISELTKGNATIVTDVGQHQMWTAQFYTFRRPRQLLTSGGLGTMGYGLPAAIGAAIADPDATVVCICGDGGFRMTSAELATAVRYKLPIKIIVLNNGCLGMVRQWQSFYFNNRFAHSVLQDSNPDFQKLAESYGAMALRAIKTEELDFMLAKAFSVSDRPVVLECLVDPEENVLPMVSPGACLHEMVE